MHSRTQGPSYTRGQRRGAPAKSKPDTIKHGIRLNTAHAQLQKDSGYENESRYANIFVFIDCENNS
jgi:hypothetical protein